MARSLEEPWSMLHGFVMEANISPAKREVTSSRTTLEKWEILS
jgi:hypothetical protein